MKKKETFTGKKGEKSKEIHQHVVIWRWRKHKSWQWSITLIWAAADTVLQADALSAADKGNSDKAKLVWEMWASEDFFVSLWFAKSHFSYQLCGYSLNSAD